MIFIFATTISVLKLLNLIRGHFSSSVHQKQPDPNIWVKDSSSDPGSVVMTGEVNLCGGCTGPVCPLSDPNSQMLGLQLAVSGNWFYSQSCSLPRSSLYPGTGWCKEVYVCHPHFSNSQQIWMVIPASEPPVGSWTPLLQLPPVQIFPLLILLTSLSLQVLISKQYQINILLANLFISILDQGSSPAKGRYQELLEAEAKREF